MSKTVRIPALAAAFATAVSVGPIVRADEAPQGQPVASTLQEVVVTAQKREEKLHDVPMGVTAITTEALDQKRLVSLADLESQVPALSLQQILPGQTRINIRGENVGSVGSTVATYVDDTPFGSSNALANGALFTGDFDTWDLQRVEVLRGPQGTLYGAGSEGGLLKYVTNPPDPTKVAAAVEVGGEDVAHGESGGSAKGMINLPIGDRAAFRLSGYYATMPGYIDDPSLGEKDVNHALREGLRAALLVDFTDNFSVRLNAYGQNLHLDGTPYVDVVGTANTPLTPPANQLQPVNGDYEQQRFINEPSNLKYRIYSGTLNWNLGWGSATSITSYGTSKQSALTDATSFPLAALGPNGTYGLLAGLFAGPLPPGATGTGVGLVEDVNIEKFTEELRLASAAGQTLEWQVGAFYTHESSTLAEMLPSFYIPSQANTGLASLENINVDALYREWSAFAQATYHFSPAWDLALGGRWSENKQSATQDLSGLALGSPPAPVTVFTGESTATDFTYSIAPRWHLTQDTMLYGRIATGYRPGGPNVLPPGAPPAVEPTYTSDSTVNYEVGTRTTQLDNRLSIDVAAFYIDWKDIQLLEDVAGFNANVNGGTARSQGLEWTLALTPVTGLTFSLTGAYVDAKLTGPAINAGGNDGDPLPYAPKWTSSLDGAYTWAAFADYNGFAGATWSYIGSRWADFSSTQTGLTTFEPNPRAELPSYNTVNLRAGLENARWMFELYAKNVGDVRGVTYYNGSGAPNFGGSIGLVQPRTIGATITARF
jgi:outer membrane receptor protein involved in Fe transport